MTLEDIPAFLKIPQAERRAAWEKFRAAASKPPAEPPVKRIIDPPGASPHDDTDS